MCFFIDCNIKNNYNIFIQDKEIDMSDKKKHMLTILSILVLTILILDSFEKQLIK